MQEQQLSSELVFAIKRAKNGGYVCSIGPGADQLEIDCSVSSMPELFDWMSRSAGRHYSDLPYKQPTLQLQQPAAFEPRMPPPVPHREQMREQPPPPGFTEPEPLPPGIVPDGPSSLMDQLSKRLPRNSGLSIVPLLVCLALAHGWPFGV